MEVVVTAIPVMDKTEWRGKALVPGLAGRRGLLVKTRIFVFACLLVCFSIRKYCFLVLAHPYFVSSLYIETEIQDTCIVSDVGFSVIY